MSRAGAFHREQSGQRLSPVVLVGVLALLLRLLFWQATPDSSWPHSALYKGDADLGRGTAIGAEAEQLLQNLIKNGRVKGDPESG